MAVFDDALNAILEPTLDGITYYTKVHRFYFYECPLKSHRIGFRVFMITTNPIKKSKEGGYLKVSHGVEVCDVMEHKLYCKVESDSETLRYASLGFLMLLSDERLG